MHNNPTSNNTGLVILMAASATVTMPLVTLAEPSAAGQSHGLQEFTTIGDHTWTAPEGVDHVTVELWGGSGGGGGAGESVKNGDPPECHSGAWGGGGGGGGYLRAVIAVVPGETYIVRVGAGGDGGVGGGSQIYSNGLPGEGGAATEFAMHGLDGTVLAFAGGGQGGGGGGLDVTEFGQAGAGGAVTRAAGIKRPGTDGGLCIELNDEVQCLTFYPGFTARGTMSPPANDDPIIISLFGVFPGQGGLPSLLTGACGPGQDGMYGNDGYAILQW